MSRWTHGTRAPVTEEVDTTSLPPVEGALPPLTGRLVRMGPNPIGPVAADHHWFAGPGMVHAIDLDGGRPVRFANRWVRTPEVSAALGEAPVLEPTDRPDLANTSALRVAGDLLAMTETCAPIRLGADLETVGRQDFGGGVVEFTAHPHTDPVTGEVFAVGYAGDDDAACTVHRIGPDATLLESRRVDLLGPRSIHDVAVSERHVVVWDLPLAHTGDPATFFPYAWDHDGAARVGLLARDDLAAEPRWFDIDPCWVFHPLNAFDTDTGVVVDVVRFDRIFDTDRTGPGDPHPPQLWRWEIDTERRAVTTTLVDARVQEFPRLDERCWGRPHRFGYTVELVSASGGPSILAHDLRTGTSDAWTTEAGRSLSEAVFVPGSADAAEGEGWLLAIDSDTASSDLVVLDATDVAAGPLGRVRLPQRIPDGFHGDWIPA